MKLFANENLFEPIIGYLRKKGHDVLSVREGSSGISDDEVYKRACNEKLVIITMDKDFSRILRFPPEKCAGIIVVKIYKRTVEETLALFKKHFTRVSEKDISRNLMIITADGVRIHRTAKQHE
jgi:predicted nuclease of predicted toxin-antitoxin system